MKKILAALMALAVALILVFCFSKIHNGNKTINSFSAVMCSARDFYTSEDGSYLEVVFDDDKNTVKKISVKDEAIIEKISNSDLNDIIGVNIVSSVPEKILGEKHFRTDTNALYLLIECEEFDDYFEIADVSFADE